MSHQLLPVRGGHLIMTATVVMETTTGIMAMVLVLVSYLVPFVSCSRGASSTYIRGPLHRAPLRCSSVETSKVAPSSRLAGRAHRRSRCDGELTPRVYSSGGAGRLNSAAQPHRKLRPSVWTVWRPAGPEPDRRRRQPSGAPRSAGILNSRDGSTAVSTVQPRRLPRPEVSVAPRRTGIRGATKRRPPRGRCESELGG